MAAMLPITIIAEIGINHNGSMQCAYKLIDEASKAGADFVKFQIYSASASNSKYAGLASYQRSIRSSLIEEDVLGLAKLVSLYELNHKQLTQLKDYCRSINTKFAVSLFDMFSLRQWDLTGEPFIKVPSGEITNFPLLRQIGENALSPIYLSTGMANLGEIEAAIDVLELAGTMRNQITVLHCTTEYPAPLDEVNLRAMQTIAKAFDVAVGYSDHTEGIAVPIAAVALGATVIEKHFTLDRNMEGPDHRASLEPDQFKLMVQGIRAIEQAMGDGIKRPTASELANLPIVRKSLVAAKEIKPGEVFTTENITAKRPGTGISPMRWDELIGRPSARTFAPDELIEL